MKFIEIQQAIYVTEYMNDRIVADGNGPGDSSNQLSNPLDVIYDTKRNHMYQNNLESEIRINSKRQANLQHTVAILTTFVAAGTIISGIYYLLEILKIFRPRWFGM